MKKFKKLAIIALVVTMITSYIPVMAKESTDDEDYTQYVDPFVGTDVDYGQQFPGSVVPYGLVKLSPDTYPHTNDDHAGYDYSKNRIAGFSHTRVEGVGGQGAGGDVLITPTYVNYTRRPEASSKAMLYSHDQESATPGYYEVELTPKTGSDENAVDNESLGKIKAEMTSAIRTGFHQYTFPEDGSVSLLVDLNYTYHGTDIRNAVMEIDDSNDDFTAISGRFSGKNVSGHGKYTLYFYLETQQKVSSFKTWNGSRLYDKDSQTGNDLGVILNFDAKSNEPVRIKVSLSTVSSEQAKIDMHNEIPDWDFDQVKADAKDAWNDVLGKIKIENSAQSDPDGSLKKLFYTHLYRMFMTPVNATSTSNTYRATDGKVYEANDYVHYDSWTLWDDFRKYPMIGLVVPDVYKDIIRSLADTMTTGIGTWGIDSQTVPTVRTEHAVALLADGAAKGYIDYENLLPAYQKAKEIADATVNSEVEALGYVPGRVDKTVEFSYDDWAIALLAKQLGKEDDYQKYLKRSFNYLNLYRENAVGDMGILWPKDANGNWMSADPERYGDNGLYQGTLWQYTWWDSNDVNGLMNAMGGKENALTALSYLFGEQDPNNGKAMLHTNTNEIDLHTPYLFNYAGKPSKTQYWIRQIYTKETWNRYSGTGEYNPPRFEKVYKLDPQGLMETMDDDAGTMASMFVGAAMGLFPLTPGDTTYQIGTPFFEKMTLDVGNGKTFTIEANNVSSDNFYIQSATLNGQEFNQTWLDYSQIIRGGTLSFNMSNTPSSWGEDSAAAFSSSDYVDTSIYSDDNISFSTKTFNESEANDGTISDVINVNVKNTTFNSIDETMITAQNIPSGLTLKTELVDEHNLTLSLEGKADKHDILASIDNLQVTFSDQLFAEAIDSNNKTVNLRVNFEDPMLTYSQSSLPENEANDGSINGEVAIELTGDMFTGDNGEDFVNSKKVVFANVPEGLTPQVIKVSDTKVKLSFTGKALSHDQKVSDIKISFQDNAFVSGNANMITNSSYGGLQALVLDFITDWKLKLANLIDQANGYHEDDYTKTSYQKLKTEITNAASLLETGDNQELQTAYLNLSNAIYDLKTSQDGFNQLEGESSDLNSGNGLKNESMNLGGTYDNAWIAYEKLDFTKQDVSSFTIRYVNNSTRCASDARIEIHTDSYDGPLVQTIDLPATGSSWNDYQEITTMIEDASKLNGEIHDVYFVLKGTTSSSNPYIINLDYVRFNSELILNANERIEAEEFNDKSSGIVNDGSNIGGVTNNSWTAYKNIKFDGSENTFEIRYAGQIKDTFKDAKVNVYLDSMDSTPVTTITVPPTGTNWSRYVTNSIKLDSSIEGIHTVYLQFVGSEANKTYVANVDYFRFVKALELNVVSEGNGFVSVPAPVANGDVTLTFTPDDGYMVKQVLVDGQEVDYDLNSNQYTLKNVIQNHDVKVIFALKTSDKTYGIYQFEDYDQWSGGNLKVETSKDSNGDSLTNIGGTYDGAWIKYSDMEFDGQGLNSIDVRYVNNSSRCGSNARLEIYLDEIKDNPAATVLLPVTGSDWSVYNTTTAILDGSITGRHDVYVVMKADVSSSYPYVGNFDWIRFNEAPKSSYGQLEAENKTEMSSGLQIETSKDLENNSLINIAHTFPGDWLKYSNLNFDGKGLSEISVRYANNTSRCNSDARLDFYLDSPEGTPFASINLPGRQSSWSDYQVATVTLDQVISGNHDLYVVMAGSDSSKYIANIDWFSFKELDYDKTSLEALYQESLVILDNQNMYTESSFNSFKEVMDSTKIILDSNVVTQEVIDNQITLLQNAIDQLEIAVESDKTALQMAVDTANTLKAQGALDNVVPAVVTEFESALAEAESILADTNADQTTIDTSFYRLANAIHMLEFVKGDKTALEALINEANNYVEENYTPDSWAGFKEALDAAIEVMNDENALEADVVEALNNLKDAMTSLVIKVDKTKLQEAYDKVNGLDKSLYTEGSVANLAEPMANAKAVLEDPNATQTEVDSAYKALIEAYLDLRLIPNKDLLQGLINKANSLNAANYSAKTWSVMAEALEKANAVLDDPEATQAEVDNAKEALTKAMAGLEVNEASNPVKAGDTTASVATGDEINIRIFAIGLLLSAVIILRKKKELS